MKKKKFDIKIFIIFILIIILCIIVYLYSIKNKDEEDILSYRFGQSSTQANQDTSESITSTGEITSALTEKVELHATYYLDESLVSENTYAVEDENLIEYTNGEYLIAPYNCVITSINLPNEGEQCTNEHYIEIMSTNQLSMEFYIDETEINKIYIGQEAIIKISALENKEYIGYVTNISSTAKNGSFLVTVQFTNDGDISIGMTGKCSIELER